MSNFCGEVHWPLILECPLSYTMVVVSNKSVHFHPRFPYHSIWRKDLAISAFAQTPKERGKKECKGKNKEEKKTKMQMNLWQNHSKLLSQIQRISVTGIQKYIKQMITLSPDCPTKSLWSKQA